MSSLYGGTCLGISGIDFVLFYDWESHVCLGRVDAEVKDVQWNNDSSLVVKAVHGFYHLLFRKEQDDDEAFELRAEYTESYLSGSWVSGLFFYVSESHKLCLGLRGKQYVLANLGAPLLMLEYLDNHERFFFFMNNCNVTSYKLSKALLGTLRFLDEQLTLHEECLQLTVDAA